MMGSTGRPAGGPGAGVGPWAAPLFAWKWRGGVGFGGVPGRRDCSGLPL